MQRGEYSVHLYVYLWRSVPKISCRICKRAGSSLSDYFLVNRTFLNIYPFATYSCQMASQSSKRSTTEDRIHQALFISTQPSQVSKRYHAPVSTIQVRVGSFFCVGSHFSACSGSKIAKDRLANPSKSKGVEGV